MAEWASQFDGALEVRPPLADAQLHEVPAKRGLLLMLAESDSPLMLLSSADIRGRLRSRLQAPPAGQGRSRRADLRQVTRKVLWRLTHSHFETDLCYLAAARAIWPTGYVKLLSWPVGHFVRVDPAEAAPHFTRTSDIAPPPGLYLGPFATGKLAGRFIETIEDVFDLCRDPTRLRLSPRAQPCAYRQMRRCCGVCEGAVSMEQYRELVAAAARAARGDRSPALAELERSMKQAADELRFEQAAAIKTKMRALDSLAGGAYEHVADAETFQFVIVQPGPGAKTLNVFLADRGLIVPGPRISRKLEREELSDVLERMAKLVGDGGTAGRYDRWRMALVARYLHGAPQRRGLLLRWDAGLTADRLAEHIEQWAAGTGPKRARRTGGGESQSCQ